MTMGPMPQMQQMYPGARAAQPGGQMATMNPQQMQQLQALRAAYGGANPGGPGGFANGAALGGAPGAPIAGGPPQPPQMPPWMAAAVQQRGGGPMTGTFAQNPQMAASLGGLAGGAPQAWGGAGGGVGGGAPRGQAFGYRPAFQGGGPLPARSY